MTQKVQCFACKTEDTRKMYFLLQCSHEMCFSCFHGYYNKNLHNSKYLMCKCEKRSNFAFHFGNPWDYQYEMFYYQGGKIQVLSIRSRFKLKLPTKRECEKMKFDSKLFEEYVDVATKKAKRKREEISLLYKCLLHF